MAGSIFACDRSRTAYAPDLCGVREPGGCNTRAPRALTDDRPRGRVPWWFWRDGVGKMKETSHGTYIMVYVLKTGMFGWARRVLMAMSLFVLCCAIYWACVEFLRPWTMWKISKARQDFVLAVHEWESNEEHLLGHASSAKSEAECTKNTCACEQADDACPRTSCPLCSPTKFQFQFDREATLVV